MKKAFLFTLAILTVLSMVFALSASPVAAKGGEDGLTFYSAQYIPGKGLVFKFKVNGDYTWANPSVVINGQEFALDCVLNDDGDLACTANQGLGQLVGTTATVTINGQTVSMVVRDATPVTPVVPVELPVCDPASGCLVAAEYSPTDATEAVWDGIIWTFTTIANWNVDYCNLPTFNRSANPIDITTIHGNNAVNSYTINAGDVLWISGYNPAGECPVRLVLP